MKQEINIENWNRKEHFQFFDSFDDPYFGITTNLDCTNLYKEAKKKNIPFNSLLLHTIMETVNKTEEFKIRIEDDKLFIYNKINISSTIMRDDNMFCFSYFDHDKNFEQFQLNLEKETTERKKTKGLPLDDNNGRIDVIHYSAVPWFSFTEMHHPLSLKGNRGIPKISVGKYFTENEILKIPISISVHHGIMDGYHVGKFLEELQKEMNKN